MAQPQMRPGDCLSRGFVPRSWLMLFFSPAAIGPSAQTTAEMKSQDTAIKTL